MMNELVTAVSTLTLAQAQTDSAPSSLLTVPWLIILFVMMYFLLLRPQQKKAKETEAMIKAAKTGDRVVAAGGILGLITNVKDSTVILKVADNTKIEVLKTSIVSVTKSDESSSAS